MKKFEKKFGIVMLILVTIIMSSCSKKEVAKVNLNYDIEYVVDVYGDEDDFFTPVAGIYSVTELDGKMSITIEFEKSQKTSKTNYTVEEFVLYPMDKAENTIKINGKEILFQADNKHNAAQELINAGVGDKVKVTFSYTPDNEQTRKLIIDNIYTCGIDLTLEAEEEDVDNIVSEAIEAEDISNENADILLNQLEVMINQLAQLDEWSDAYDVKEDQILDLMDKIDDLDMSSAQESRYENLDNKFDNL